MRLAIFAATLAFAGTAFAETPAQHPFDKDADGRVSLQEWLDAGTERRADLEKRLAAAQPEVIENNFKGVDANADGFLDAEELAAAKAARDAKAAN